MRDLAVQRRPHRPAALMLSLVTAAASLLLISGTGASWTDARQIPGTTMHSGRLDLRVNGVDAVSSYTALDAAGLEPGQSVATTVTVGNNGDVPLSYTVTVSGTDADGRGLSSVLTPSVTDASLTSVTTDGPTCDGSPLGGPRQLFPGQTEKVCVAVRLPAAAPPSVADSVSHLTIAATASNGGWTDAASVTGTVVSTISLTAPTLTCTPGIGKVSLSWPPVPGATGYRLHTGPLGQTVTVLDSDSRSTTLSWLGSTLTGQARVEAVFGSSDWISPASTTHTYSILSALGLSTCT